MNKNDVLSLVIAISILQVLTLAAVIQLKNMNSVDIFGVLVFFTLLSYSIYRFIKVVIK